MTLAVSLSNRNDPVHKAVRNAPPRVARGLVLHLARDLRLSAEGRGVVDLAVQTHRVGWRPIVASAGGALVLEAERAAVRHKRMPLNKKNIFAHWRTRVHLETVIQREKPGLIHAHGFDVLSPAYGISALHRLPLLIDVTEPASVTKSLQKLLDAAVERQARFRVPSQAMKEHLQKDFGIPGKIIHLVPPGIDMQWYDPSRVSPERLQKLADLWRLPEQATILITATPFAPGFGHKQLIEALVRMKRDDVFTVMIGEDTRAPGTRGEIEKLLVKNGLEGRVVMPEHCTDWPAACWLATLVIAANTLPRGQAPELLAAQAMGRPTVVTECGANTEMVRGGETSWVVPPDNIDLLTQALEEAIQMTGAQRIDLAKRTRQFIYESFRMEFWCAGITELYSAMLGFAPIACTA